MTRIFPLATPVALLTAFVLLAPGAARADEAPPATSDVQGQAEPEAPAADQPEGEGASTPGGDPLVKEALAGVADQIEACFRTEGAEAAAGQLVLSWRVRDDGRFEAVKVKRSDLGSEAAEQCAIKVVEGITLPPRPQATPVEFVWQFDPASDEPLVSYQGEGRRWSAQVNVGTSTGMTLFHPTDYVRSSQTAVLGRAGVGGSWRLNDRMSLGLNWGFGYEMTLPNNSSGRRFFPSDPGLSLSLGELFSDAFTGISVTGSLSASVGLSPTSRWATRLGTLGAGLSAARPFLDGRLMVFANLGGTGFLHRYRSPVGDPVADDGIEMLLARKSGPEAIGDLVAVDGANPAAAVSLSFGVQWRITDKTSAGANLAYGRSWSYTPALDALSPQVTDINGDAVVTCGGLCPSDSVSGSLGASWQAFDAWTLSANLATAGAVFGYRRIDPQDPDPSALEGDARVLRFPFWDPNLQATSLSVSMSRGF